MKEMMISDEIKAVIGEERKSFDQKAKQRLPFIDVKVKEGPFRLVKQIKGESGHSSWLFEGNSY